MPMPTSRSPEAPCEWMRLFAVRLAQRRPDISADEAVRAAIREFRRSGHLPPERAAARRSEPGAPA